MPKSQFIDPKDIRKKGELKLGTIKLNQYSKTVKEEKFFPNSGFITFNYNVNGRKTVWVRFIRKIDKGDNAAYAFGALFKEVCVRINGRI